MSDSSAKDGVPSKIVELAVALLLVSVGGIVIADSLRLGAGWSSDGPQSGYFPFYIGAILVTVALVMAGKTLATWRHHQDSFASSTQLGLVARMFIPIVLFVATLSVIGIYFAAALYIAIFMRWQGRFSLAWCALVSIAVPCVLFLLFEIWFHVPLPKGPIEQWLGF